MKKFFTAKLWKVMKICAVQGMIVIIVCGVALARPNYAQVLDREISITITDLPFEKALKEIEDVAKVKFAYSIDQLQDEPNISLSIEKQTLGDVLEELLTARKIQYRVHEKQAVITLKKHPAKTNLDHSPVREGTNVRETEGRRIEITGIVKEASTQAPMAGVNVIVKGTATGTTTDADGRYSVAADENDILVFSFIGYASVETSVNGRTMIDITMTEDALSLGEVVVNAGYWDVKERERTGSIGRITSREINRQPVSTPLMALQGRIPGVVVTPMTGVAGSAHTIQIRGQNSLRTDANYPLYVIDGVPIDSRPIHSTNSVLIGGIDPLSAFNPEDIESIEVLKDADATAIYGSRGANGVILITTKRARQGTTDVNVQAYAGAGQVSRTMQLLKTEQYLGMRNEAFFNDGPAALADLNNPDYAIYFPDMKIWSQTKYTDWQEKLLGSTAQISDAQLSLSGGNSATSFRLGGGYHKETTVFPEDFGYQKATMHASLSHASSNNKFRISLSMNYGKDENTLINDNFVYTALTLPPNAPGYDEHGNLAWEGYDFNLPNPYSRLEIKHTAKTSNLISSGRFTYEMLPGLKIIANLGLTDIKTQQVINTPYNSMAPGTTAPNNSTFGDRNATSWIAEPQLSYSKSMSRHNVDMLVGSTWQNSSTDSRWIRGVGYLSDELLGNLNAASQILKLSADNMVYRYNALFGRIGYNFDGRYFVNLTARRDGSSRFGPDNQFSNFGAVGIAWIFTDGGFRKDRLRPLSFGKLRGSYGTTGNDQIGDYAYLSTFGSSSATYQGSSILVPSGLANPEYAWEINRKMELAIDLGFFRDRILLGANFYLNRSSNQLVGYPLPSVAGFTSVQANLDAVVQNSGLEFILRSANIEGDNFSWNTAINLTIPRNELLSYPNLEGSSYANLYEVGEPLTILKLYELTRIDPQTGLYQFRDTDGNDVINIQDRRTVINIGRQYYAGLTNIIRYKSLEISLFAEFVKQRVRGYLGTFLQAPGTAMNQPAFVASPDRWMAVGSEAQIQKFTNDQRAYDLARNSDMNVDNGSFLRIKTVTLSYRLPSTWIDRMHLNDASVFVHGQNLFLITKYKGLDPEIPGNSQLPQLRMITAGVSFKL